MRYTNVDIGYCLMY